MRRALMLFMLAFPLKAVELRVDPRVASRFDPRTALGGTIDVHAGEKNV